MLFHLSHNVKLKKAPLGAFFILKVSFHLYKNKINKLCLSQFFKKYLLWLYKSVSLKNYVSYNQSFN